MRTMLAATIGALTVGAVVLAYNATGVGSSSSEGALLNSTGIDGAVVVTCDPAQRAVIRRASLNGQIVNQVECSSQPYDDSLSRGAVYDSGSGIGDARLVRVSSPVYERPILDQRAPVRRVVRRAPQRSWQTSALIIGGSAGAGAGVGAAVGGRKGALLGAAIGGGAATLFDQLTRHRNDR